MADSNGENLLKRGHDRAALLIDMLERQRAELATFRHRSPSARNPAGTDGKSAGSNLAAGENAIEQVIAAIQRTMAALETAIDTESRSSSPPSET
jgi:hypothetical protein